MSDIAEIGKMVTAKALGHTDFGLSAVSSHRSYFEKLACLEGNFKSTNEVSKKKGDTSGEELLFVHFPNKIESNVSFMGSSLQRRTNLLFLVCE